MRPLNEMPPNLDRSTFTQVKAVLMTTTPEKFAQWVHNNANFFKELLPATEDATDGEQVAFGFLLGMFWAKYCYNSPDPYTDIREQKCH